VAGTGAARERRSIHEVLRKNPQLKAEADRMKFKRQSDRRSLNPAKAQDRAVLDDLFLCYDPNGDGTGSLSYREFSRLVKDLGLALSKGEVEGMMKQLDDNGNGLIEIDEFAHFFNHAGTRGTLKADAKGQDGQKSAFVFKLFSEFESGGNGVDIEGLRLLVKAGRLDQGPEKLTPKDVDLFFKRLDIDKTGFLSVEKVTFIFDSIEACAELKEGIEMTGPSDVDMLNKVFDKFDSSFKGEMNKFDLLAAVQFLGHQITQNDVDGLLAKVDENNDGSVGLDEFISFFAQMSNTEELLRELQLFRKAQTRQKYIYGGAFILGLILLGAGTYMTMYTSDSVTLMYGYAVLFGGAVILSMMVLPRLPALVYEIVVNQGISILNPTRIMILNLLMSFGVAALFFREFDETAGLASVSYLVMFLSALLGLVFIAQAAYLGCKTAGLMEPIIESDDEMEKEKREEAEKASALERGSGRRASERGSMLEPKRGRSETDQTISTKASSHGSKENM
jgi:Ca2+-binding EF-hand superfamily protein